MRLIEKPGPSQRSHTPGLASTKSTSRPLSSLTALDATLAALFVALTAVLFAGFLLRRADLPLTLPPLLGAVAGALALLTLALFLRRQRLTWDPAQLVAVGLVAAAVGGAYVAFAWPTFYPTATSTDFANHFRVIEAIVESRTVTVGGYPQGAHLLVAFACWASGIAPLRLIAPAAAAFVWLAAVFTVATTSSLLCGSRCRGPATVASGLLLFQAYGYFVHQFTTAFFLSHIGASMWLVAGFYWLVRFRATRDSLFSGLAALCLPALILTYPHWSAVAVAAGALFFLIDDGVALRWRIAISAIVVAVSLVALLGFLRDLMIPLLTLRIVMGEGAVVTPTVGEFGAAWVALALAGLVITLGRWREHAALLAALAGIAATMAVAYAGAAFQLNAYYYAYKLWHPAIYPLAVLAAIALARLAEMHRARIPSRGGLASLLVGAALFLPACFLPLQTAWQRANWHPTIDENVYKAAVWARQNLGGEPITFIVAYWNTPHFLHVGVLRRNEADLGPRYDALRRADVDRWVQPSDGFTYAITDDVTVEPLQGATVEFRSGDAAVLRRPSTPVGDRPPPVALPDTPVRVGRQLEITSVNPGPWRTDLGRPIPLTIQLHAIRTLTQDYSVVARAYDREGRSYGEARTLIGPSSSRHKPIERGSPLTANLPLTLDAAAPAGIYNIEVFILSLPSQETLTMYDDQRLQHRRLVLGPLVVTSPEIVTDGNARPPMREIGVSLGPGIALRGIDSDLDAASPGKALGITLYWSAKQAGQGEYTRFVQLLDRDNRVIAQSDSYPANGAYPTSAWQEGDLVRDRVTLLLPAAAQPGEYRLIAGMYDATTMRRLPVLHTDGQSADDYVPVGTVKVTAGPQSP